jgi:tetratricopeptide (TPR) repeat protein
VDALVAHEERERICKGIGDASGLKLALMNQILVLEQTTEFQKAIRVFKEMEDFCQKIGDAQTCAETMIRRTKLLARLAKVALEQKNFKAALIAYKDQTQVWEILQKPQPWAESLANQAIALDNLERTKEGIPLVERAVRIAATAGLPDLGVMRSLLESLRKRIKKGWFGL